MSHLRALQRADWVQGIKRRARASWASTLTSALLPLFQSPIIDRTTDLELLQLLATSRHLSVRSQRRLLARPSLRLSLLRNPHLHPQVQRDVVTLGAEYPEVLAQLAGNRALLSDLQEEIARSDSTNAHVVLAMNKSLTPSAEEVLVRSEHSLVVTALSTRTDPRVHLGLPVRLLRAHPRGREVLEPLRASSPDVYDILVPTFAGSGSELAALIENFAAE